MGQFSSIILSALSDARKCTHIYIEIELPTQTYIQQKNNRAYTSYPKERG